MAVIYETKEDFEKAKLSEQAKDLHLKASHESGFGMSLIGANFILEYFSRYAKNYPSLMRVGGNILGLLGVVESVKSFFTSSKARDREHELERMGPQVFAMPHEDFNPAIADFGAPSKVFTQTIQPTSAIDPRSLFEHAEKPSCCDKSI